MTIFTELYERTAISSMTEQKVEKDRALRKVNLRTTGCTLRNVKQTTPVNQAITRLERGNTIPMQNGLHLIRLNRYNEMCALDIERELKKSDKITYAQFDSQDRNTVTFLIGFAKGVLNEFN